MIRSTTRRLHLGAACLLLAAALFAVPAAACPLCSEENEARQEETGVNVAMGFSVSVLVMLALPMMMVGGLGYALYRNQQRALQENRESGRQSDTPKQP